MIVKIRYEIVQYNLLYIYKAILVSIVHRTYMEIATTRNLWEIDRKI